MKKHLGLEELRKDTTLDVRLQVDYSYATAKRINEILQKKKMSRKDLADALQKKESQISKWMTGAHNFTYATIAKIEAVLGEKIIEVNLSPKAFIFQFPAGESSSVTVSIEGDFNPGRKSPKSKLLVPIMEGEFELNETNCGNGKN